MFLPQALLCGVYKVKKNSNNIKIYLKYKIIFAFLYGIKSAKNWLLKLMDGWKLNYVNWRTLHI